MERLLQLFSFDEASPLIFTQLDFWIFFLVVMSIFSFIHKHKLTRSIFLFVVSLFFYFKTSGLLVLLLASSIIVNYFIGRGLGITNSETRKKVFVTTFTRNLGRSCVSADQKFVRAKHGIH